MKEETKDDTVAGVSDGGASAVFVGRLRRDLGALESYAALIGILIGAGIFKVTSDAGAAELANLRTVEFFARHLFGIASATTQPNLSELWDEHVKYEFATRDTDATLRTMVEDAYVNHVPVLTGGVGRDQLREFYSKRFIPRMPPDTSMTPVSRTVGSERVVDEMVFEFTHTIEMDWMLPGVEPTGRHVRVPLVVVVHFREGKLAHEHIYWDQASVLVQLGLIEGEGLPVAGVESAEKVLDPSLPANRLIERAGEERR